MASTRKLIGVAHSLLDSFVSRNNDLDGYWALGLLYSETANYGLNEIRLTLYPKSSSVSYPLATCIGKVWKQRFSEQIVKNRIGIAEIQEAIIFVRFKACPTEANNRTWKYKLTYGDPFAATISISTKGKHIEVTYGGWCGKHDPAKEIRSTRRLS